jgi:hypothetical protein
MIVLPFMLWLSTWELAVGLFRTRQFKRNALVNIVLQPLLMQVPLLHILDKCFNQYAFFTGSFFLNFILKQKNYPLSVPDFAFI